MLTRGLGTSRDELINLLRAHNGINVEDLASSLGVTRQCVRKHLELLEREGYVEHAPERGDRGRPAFVYRLTPKADGLFPKRYDLVVKSILQQVGALWGNRGLNQVFCGCADDMIARLSPRLEGLSFDARVQRLAQLLCEEGYEAQVEQLADGSYELSERNCPMTEVARGYGQVCERELAVYRQLLQTHVFRESNIATGATRCAYRVLRPQSAPGEIDE